MSTEAATARFRNKIKDNAESWRNKFDQHLFSRRYSPKRSNSFYRHRKPKSKCIPRVKFSIEPAQYVLLGENSRIRSFLAFLQVNSMIIVFHFTRSVGGTTFPLFVPGSRYISAHLRAFVKGPTLEEIPAK